jgi:predicted nucleotidyltransferase
MNVIYETLRQAATDLNRRNLKWALVGGFAVSARAEPRFTRDVDIAVAVANDESAEMLVRSLLPDGYTVLASIEQDATSRLATVRLARSITEDEEIVVDLLFASSGIEPEIAASAEVLEILPGLSVPVATTAHLIALKILARNDDSRPQDLMDLRALRAAAVPDDIADAREALSLITERGFNRNRDLQAALEEMMG